VQLAVNFARNNNIRLTIKYVLRKDTSSKLTIVEIPVMTSWAETPAVAHFKSGCIA